MDNKELLDVKISALLTWLLGLLGDGGGGHGFLLRALITVIEVSWVKLPQFGLSHGHRVKQAIDI